MRNRLLRRFLQELLASLDLPQYLYFLLAEERWAKVGGINFLRQCFLCCSLLKEKNVNILFVCFQMEFSSTFFWDGILFNNVFICFETEFSSTIYLFVLRRNSLQHFIYLFWDGILFNILFVFWDGILVTISLQSVIGWLAKPLCQVILKTCKNM
jgi:hypothetical protein